MLKQQEMFSCLKISQQKILITTVFYEHNVFFLKPIVLTTIYVKTTGNVCGSENTPLKTVVTTVF